MKNLLLKLWNFLKQKNNLLIAIVVVLLLSMATIIYFQRKKIANLNDQYQTEVNLNNALNDTVSHYKNKRDEWVAEKLTLQTTVKNLENNYNKLSASQKELVDRIKEIDKKNTVITAALIKMSVKVDSLLARDGDNGTVVTVYPDSTVNINNLASKDTTFLYDINVNKVLPAFPNIKPTLLFKSLEFPNTQFVNFYWKNDKKSGYPIAFSVSNSNKYVKVFNIDSYAIPALSKEKLNPNGWQKVGNFFIRNGKNLLYVGIGAVGGATAYYIITK